MAKDVVVIDRGWGKIIKNATTVAKGKAASVGFQGSEAEMIDPEHGGMTNVELAAIHEFGTKDGKIPARPMIQQTFSKHSSKIDKAMVKVSKDFFDGKNIDGELRMVGEDFRSDIIQEIRNDSFKEWAQSTEVYKEKQGRSGDVPLWMSGQLVNALTTVVVEGKTS
jgi:phage gpG-like protein